MVCATAHAHDPSLNLTSSERAWLASHPTIRVGFDPGFPPMEYAGPDGELQGMTQAYLQLLESRLDLHFQVLRGVSWNDAVNLLRARQLDLLPCVIQTDRRRDFMAVTQPYLRAPSVIVTREETAKAHPALTLADLQGRTMAAAESGYSFDRLRSTFPGIPLLITATPGEAFKAVALGKAEAALENLATTEQLIKKHGLTNLVVAGRSEFDTDEFTMGVRSDWPLFVSILNKTLATITPQEQAAILERWTAVQLDVPERPGALSRRTLLVAASLLGAFLVLFCLWNLWLRRQIRFRKEAEAALRESEARLSMILAATGDGLWQCDLASGHCHFSSSWHALLGYTPGDMPARWGAFEHLTHPDDQSLLQDLRAGRAMDEQGRFRLELRMLRKDGIWLPVLARGRVVEWNAEGLPRVVAGVLTDITTRKQAELALLESEQRARALFHNSPVSLWDEDLSELKRYLDGLRARGVQDFRAYFEAQPQALRYAVALVKIRQVNAMTLSLLGAADEHVLQQSLGTVFCEATYGAVLETVLAFLDGATSHEVETLHRTVAGKPLHVCIRVQIAKGSEETWEQVLVSAQDLSAIKEAETLREEVDRITRHDLKNPLAAIISLPRLLLEEGEGRLDQEQRRALELIHDTGWRMLRMINLSLDLFKMERGVYQYTPVPVDLVDVTADVLAQARPAAQERNLQLVQLCEEGACDLPSAKDRFKALGEELLIFSMLSNLVTNALEASDNGQTVTVRLERSLHWVVCSVHNQGTVPDDIRDHLFEKFVTTKPGGTGLGCYSARLMAETMRGEIALSSSTATGTTLTVRLPIA
ncbi:hypothetical protein JCM14635_06490 [Megalodesulfovibrio paquesii]